VMESPNVIGISTPSSPWSTIDFSFTSRTPLVNSTPATGTATAASDIEEGSNPPGDNAAMNISVTQQLSTIFGDRYRFALFFVVLLVVKVLIENIAPNLVLISGALVLMRLRKEHNLQLSAKKKSSIKILLSLLFFSIVELALVFKFIEIYGSPNRIFQRLSFTFSFSTGNNQSELLLQHMFWCAIVLDGIVQMSVITLKIFFCAIFDVGVEIKFDDVLKMAGNYFSTAISSQNSSNRHHMVSESYSPSSPPSSQPSVSHNNSSPPLLTSFNNTGTSNSTQSDDNISNSSSSDREAAQYLQKLRLCSLLDILGLLYRSILPTPAWMAYFSASAHGSSFLSYIYLGFKVYDLSVKVRGAMEALESFVMRKAEFGHYSTASELTAPSFSCDCPICFDNPVNNPITLNCTHIFCEVCISEWLDKEKSCPVCRAPVQFVSTSFEAVKEQASSPLPILI